MAKVFLDANKFIDLVEKRSEISIDEFGQHNVFISPLSAHILIYITKKKVPYRRLNETIGNFSLVDFDWSICYKALEGPTDDLEDNVQLHSAAEAQCDVFLTNDKKLINMKFFGKTRILPELEQNN